MTKKQVFSAVTWKRPHPQRWGRHPKFEIGQRLRSPFQNPLPHLAFSPSAPFPLSRPPLCPDPGHRKPISTSIAGAAEAGMLSDGGDDDSSAPARFELQEDPSFWKDNNVQVAIPSLASPSRELSHLYLPNSRSQWCLDLVHSCLRSVPVEHFVERLVGANRSVLQVVIRVRPLSSSEISLQGNKRCVRQDSGQSVTWTGHPESRFTFDLVADEHITQVYMLFPRIVVVFVWW